jgi:hypothetical protein
LAHDGYRRGRRVALVQKIGLKRGGPNGFWSGLVDGEELDRLVQEFPDKVKISAVHSKSTHSSTEALQQPEAVSEQSIESIEKTTEVRVEETQLAVPPSASPPEKEASDLADAHRLDEFAPADTTRCEEVRPITTPIPWPRPFSTLPRRIAPNATASGGEDAT